MRPFSFCEVPKKRQILLMPSRVKSCDAGIFLHLLCREPSHPDDQAITVSRTLTSITDSAVRVTLRFHPIVNLMPFHHPAKRNRRAENKNVLRYYRILALFCLQLRAYSNLARAPKKVLQTASAFVVPLVA